MLTAKLTERGGVKFLALEIPVQTPAPSKTGKTLVVATTHGNQPTSVLVDGKPVVVGLNAYVRA